MLREAREQRQRQEMKQQQHLPPSKSATTSLPSTSTPTNVSQPLPSSSASSVPSLSLLRADNARLREENDQLHSALASMRQTLLDLTLTTSSPSTPSTLPSDEKQPSPSPSSPPLTNGHSPSPVRHPSSSPAPPRFSPEDDGYFGGYSTRRIHELMLRDRHRTLAYQRFVYANRHQFEGKVVLDVGCGTGILSLFCAKAGARLVIGVDAADIADAAKEIVRVNGYEGRVVIVKGKMEDVELPVAQVDVIVSEWMGYFLLYESMLPSVLYARDRYLRPQGAGRVYPDLAVMYIAGMQDRRHRASAVEYWHDVYGFDFSTLIQDEDKYCGSSVEVVQAEELVTSAAELRRFDVEAVTTEELDFTSTMRLTFTADESLDALVVWFDTLFERGAETEEGKVTLSTSPKEPATHWMQTVFRLHEKVVGKVGEEVEVELTAKRQEKYQRSYRVQLRYWKVDKTAGAAPPQVFVQEYSIE